MMDNLLLQLKMAVTVLWKYLFVNVPMLKILSVNGRVIQ